MCRPADLANLARQEFSAEVPDEKVNHFPGLTASAAGSKKCIADMRRVEKPSARSPLQLNLELLGRFR
jgi:hypothetical protein